MDSFMSLLIYALTKDGMIESNQYKLCYKVNCDLKELAKALLLQKTNRKNLYSQISSGLRHTIGQLKKDEIKDINDIIANIEFKKTECMELLKIELNE